ncbi:MAG: hypothetical protein IEMM0008_0069 [bacterium]|nr:MAG: hypothetical protein IEMM0008_0069 [bacterium]
MNKLLLLLIIFAACQSPNLDDRYLTDIEIYYKYSMDSNQSLEARIKYINKLGDFGEKGSSEIKKKSLHYLRLICQYLRNKQDENDLYIFNRVNDVLTELGDLDKRVKSPINRSNNDWLTSELKKKSQQVAELIESSDWDSRIYGRWSTQSKDKEEQYQFFRDASFVYKVIINRDLDEETGTFMGDYRISKTDSSLTLYFNNKNKTSFNYFIDTKRLYLDSKSFYREKDE